MYYLKTNNNFIDNYIYNVEDILIPGNVLLNMNDQ